MQHGHARARAGSAGGAVDLAGPDGDGVPARERALHALQLAGELTERNVVPAGVGGMREADLLVCGGGDPDADLGDVARLVGGEREAERLGVGDDETVAAVSRVDLE